MICTLRKSQPTKKTGPKPCCKMLKSRKNWKKAGPKKKVKKEEVKHFGE